VLSTRVPDPKVGITAKWTLRPYDDTLLSDHLASSLGNHQRLDRTGLTKFTDNWKVTRLH